MQRVHGAMCGGLRLDGRDGIVCHFGHRSVASHLKVICESCHVVIFVRCSSPTAALGLTSARSTLFGDLSSARTAQLRCLRVFRKFSRMIVDRHL